MYNMCINVYLFMEIYFYILDFGGGFEWEELVREVVVWGIAGVVIFVDVDFVCGRVVYIGVFIVFLY